MYEKYFMICQGFTANIFQDGNGIWPKHCCSLNYQSTAVTLVKNNRVIRPQDTWPQAAWTLTMHAFEQGKKNLRCTNSYRFVSSTFQIAKILVQSHFELVSLVLALGTTELVSEPITRMAVELINNHHFSPAKEMIVKATFFFM